MHCKNCYKLLLPFILASFTFFACSGAKEQAMEGDDTNNGSGKKDSSVRATVKDHSHLDGCLYMLITKSGKKLNPLNLDSTYFEDGLQVRLRFRKKDAATTCMAGQTIEVLEIEALE